ncbi:retrovirus-related pol polyprotein from transposon TNT 1-94 [Tanacetum coccineum]
MIEAAKTMLNSANLPKQFWGEAVNTACYTQNRSIIVKRHRKTTYDVFRGRSPDTSYFYVFGYPLHIHNHRDHLKFFNVKADDGFFLGYSPMAKAFRVFNIRSNDEPSPTIIPPSAEVFINPPVPQDRWSREKHIELVNILGELQDLVTTRSRIIDSEAASTHKCLYGNFISKLEPKKLIKALEEKGWIIAILEAIMIFLAYAAYMGFVLEDGTMLHMLTERRYPLSRELMIRMLDHGMEVEDESEIAITLIHLFILWTTEDGDDS